MLTRSAWVHMSNTDSHSVLVPGKNRCPTFIPANFLSLLSAMVGFLFLWSHLVKERRGSYEIASTGEHLTGPLTSERTWDSSCISPGLYDVEAHRFYPSVLHSLWACINAQVMQAIRMGHACPWSFSLLLEILAFIFSLLYFIYLYILLQLCTSISDSYLIAAFHFGCIFFLNWSIAYIVLIMWFFLVNHLKYFLSSY